MASYQPQKCMVFSSSLIRSSSIRMPSNERTQTSYVPADGACALCHVHKPCCGCYCCCMPDCCEAPFVPRTQGIIVVISYNNAHLHTWVAAVRPASLSTAVSAAVVNITSGSWCSTCRIKSLGKACSLSSMTVPRVLLQLVLDCAPACRADLPPYQTCTCCSRLQVSQATKAGCTTSHMLTHIHNSSSMNTQLQQHCPDICIVQCFKA